VDLRLSRGRSGGVILSSMDTARTEERAGCGTLALIKARFSGRPGGRSLFDLVRPFVFRPGSNPRSSPVCAA
jgi:hypothetical protein